MMVDTGGAGLELEDGDFLLKEGEAARCYWHYFTPAELGDLCAGTGLVILECGLAPEFGQTDWDMILVGVWRKGEAESKQPVQPAP